MVTDFKYFKKQIDEYGFGCHRRRRIGADLLQPRSFWRFGIRSIRLPSIPVTN